MVRLAIKPILPKHIPSGDEYFTEIKKAARKSILAAKKDFENTTKTWNHKPDFELTEDEGSHDYRIATGTDDEIYGYVDAGTRPHIIRPKRSKYLRFQSGYKAKTKVGVINSYPGGPFGADVYTRTFVLHPGFQGRKFTATIAKRRQKTFEQEISQAIAKKAKEAK